LWLPLPEVMDIDGDTPVECLANQAVDAVATAQDVR